MPACAGMTNNLDGFDIKHEGRIMLKIKKLHPKAIIFDMDGVIVDSMVYHFFAWYEALRPLGIRVSCFDVYAKEGERWEKSMRDFLLKNNIRPTAKIMRDLFVRRHTIFKKVYKRVIFNGAEELLLCLKNKGYILGLVTGTPLAQVRMILSQKIKSVFNCIISGDMVSNGKPDPEPYLKAAKQFKLKSAQCLVIENAPLGILSAKRAGMFCVAVSTSLPRDYLKKADVVVDNLTKIKKILC